MNYCVSMLKDSCFNLTLNLKKREGFLQTGEWTWEASCAGCVISSSPYRWPHKLPFDMCWAYSTCLTCHCQRASCQESDIQVFPGSQAVWRMVDGQREQYRTEKKMDGWDNERGWWRINHLDLKESDCVGGAVFDLITLWSGKQEIRGML